jgi:hypothetical protein
VGHLWYIRRVPICATPEDIIEVASRQIGSLEQEAWQYKGKEDYEYCEPVRAAVQEIDNLVAWTYGLAAHLSRQADSYEDLVELWSLMVKMCDGVLQTILSLQKDFPACVDDTFYSKVLDYRNAANKRLAGIQKEIECQNNIPAGLFPQKS